MVIEINKDIDKYQESLVMGLSSRQAIYAVTSVILGGGLVYLSYPYLGLTGSAYVAIPVVAPIALNGFYSYNGMTFIQVTKKKIYHFLHVKPLLFKSDEGDTAIRRYKAELLLEEKKNKKKGKHSFFGKGKK